MNPIVEILCRRDGISVKEAIGRVEDVRRMIAESNYGYDEVEGILATELGLEMDYIYDLI